MESASFDKGKINRLYSILSGPAFEKTDLEELCFQLDIDWEKLSGETKPEKARALIRYCQARRTLPGLGAASRAARPNEDFSFLDREGEPEAVGPAGVPRQIPPPELDFVGRAEEIARLVGAVEQDGARLLGLRGQGGVGKTQLARVLAQRLAEGCPDGQILVELNGMRGTAALPPEQGLAKVILSCTGPAVRLPESLNDLRDLYYSRLNGRRMLLLLDDARDAAQVAPFLPPPPGCLVIVTSRQHFPLAGMRPWNLDALPAAEAVELLLAFAPRLENVAGDLAELCGRLPFALRVAAGIAAEKATLAPEDVLRRVRDESRRLALTGVEPLLALSCALLPPDLRAKWYKLAVFAGDFDHQAAAWVWGLITAETDAESDRRALDQAQDDLGELSAYSLVEFTDGRCRLHDLARVYAGQQLEAGERYAVRLAHAQWYLNRLVHADKLYTQGGEHILQGLALFDRERREIEAGFAWASAAAKTLDPAMERARLELCSRYPNWGVYLLSLRQHPGEQIGWLQAGLRAARALGDRQAEGIHLGNLGIVYNALGDPRRAIELHEQQLVIAQEIGYRRGEANALGGLGMAFGALGEPGRAIELYDKSLEIMREIGDRRGEGNALGNLGLAYGALGEPRRAIELYEQRLVIAREIGDRRGEGNALGNMGIAYKNMGEAQRAIEQYEQWLAIAQEIGDRRGEASASWNLGRVYEAQGALVRAAELLQVRVDFLTAIGHPDAEKSAAYVAKLRARIAAGEDSPPE